MSQKEKEVTFKFESKAQAEAFIDWFSNQGEQSYWDGCEYLDEVAQTTHFTYNYHEIIGYNKK